MYTCINFSIMRLFILSFCENEYANYISCTHYVIVMFWGRKYICFCVFVLIFAQKWQQLRRQQKYHTHTTTTMPIKNTHIYDDNIHADKKHIYDDNIHADKKHIYDDNINADKKNTYTTTTTMPIKNTYATITSMTIQYTCTSTTSMPIKHTYTTTASMPIKHTYTTTTATPIKHTYTTTTSMHDKTRHTRRQHPWPIKKHMYDRQHPCR